MSNYCENPVLVICEVQHKDLGLPVHAYAAQDEIREDGTEKSKRVFVNLPTEVGATEAEDIGVEHLLRDVKDVNLSTLSSQVGEMVVGLRGLRSKLAEIQSYLEAVVMGGLPVNNDIMRNLQDILNLLPNLNVAELSKSMALESNDMMMVVYLASLIRSVIALHNLIDNREEKKERDAEGVRKEKEDADAKAAALKATRKQAIESGGGGDVDGGDGDGPSVMDSDK